MTAMISASDALDFRTRLPQQETSHMTEADVQQQSPPRSTSTKSFSMDDLSALLFSGVGTNMIVPENAQRGFVDDQDPKSETMPSVAVDIEHRVSDPSQSERVQLPLRFQSQVQSGCGYTSRLPPCPRQSSDVQDLSPWSEIRPQRLRQALRVHIRANDQGLQPFLHSLITSIGNSQGEGLSSSPTYTNNAFTTTQREAKDDTDPDVQSQESHLLTDAATDVASQRAHAYADRQKNAEPTVSSSPLTTRGFRQDRPDAFSYSAQPTSVPELEKSKLVDGDVANEAPASE